MKLKRVLCALAAAGITMLCGCSREAKTVPGRVTLLLERENRIITLDYRDYLAGCISAAADPSFRLETLTAAGTACSSRALYVMEHAGDMEHYGADLSDSAPECPEWLPSEELPEAWQSAENAEKLKKAAELSAGMYLEYDGEPADAQLCAVSSGATDDGGQPYLPGMELPCDKECPYYSSDCTMNDDSVRRALRDAFGSCTLPPQRDEWFTGAEYTPGGALESIRFGDLELTGEQLRRGLGLRSTVVEITCSGFGFTFSVSGRGSNRGLSVYAAERLARGGKTTEEILEYFYPGTVLRRTVCE